MFIVGQKVVCINDKDADEFDAPGVEYQPGLHGLKHGTIYQIRGLIIDSLTNALCIHLKEIIRPLHRGEEVGFDARRFRPIVEKKTDISIFTTMLTSEKVTQ